MAGGAEFGRLGVEVGVLEGAIKLDGNGETELEYACKIISELLFFTQFSFKQLSCLPEKLMMHP